MTETPRKPVLPNVVLAIVLLVPGYVLSYAPVVRSVQSGSEWGNWRFGELVLAVGSAELAAYTPVEWLIDRTILKEPFMWWGDLWGVEASFRDGSRIRCYRYQTP